MALTDDDYQLILYSLTRGTIEQSNVFAYKCTSTPPSALQLYDAFVDNVLTPIANIVSSDTVFTRIYIKNMVDTDDFFDTSTSVPGARSGSSMPPFVGAYFRYFRPNLTVHNGRKTFGSIAEGDVADGIATSAFVILLTALSDVLQSVIYSSGGDEFTPCIAKTERITNPSPPPAERVVWETLFPITSVAYVKISSQNTRKR